MPLPEPTVHILKPGQDGGSFLANKLDLNENDVLIVRGSNSAQDLEYIHHVWDGLKITNVTLFLNDKVNLDTVDEKMMNAAGWIRKPPAKKRATRKRGATKK